MSETIPVYVGGEDNKAPITSLDPQLVRQIAIFFGWKSDDLLDHGIVNLDPEYDDPISEDDEEIIDPKETVDWNIEYDKLFIPTKTILTLEYLLGGDKHLNLLMSEITTNEDGEKNFYLYAEKDPETQLVTVYIDQELSSLSKWPRAIAEKLSALVRSKLTNIINDGIIPRWIKLNAD